MVWSLNELLVLHKAIKAHRSSDQIVLDSTCQNMLNIYLVGADMHTNLQAVFPSVIHVFKEATNRMIIISYAAS